MTDEPEEEHVRGVAGLEHYERLCAMRDDEGLTWDLSGNDRAAFRWAIEQIDSIPTIRAEAMAESDRVAFEVLALLGVPKKRAKTVANGIDVLAARHAKEKRTLRAEAMAEQREKDARICETRYAHWPNIDAALLDVSMSCGAAIRNQD